MSFTEEYAWLSDFMLGETFSSCSSSMPLLDEDITTEDLKNPPLDSFDVEFKMNNFPESYDVNQEVLNLGQIPLKENSPVNQPVVQANETTFVGFNDNILPVIKTPVPATIVHEPVKETIIPPIFEVTEEEMKILKYLESQPKDVKNFTPPSPPLAISYLPSYKIIRCANCGNIFNNESFQLHICDYDEDHNLILPATNNIPTTSRNSSTTRGRKPMIKEEPQVPPEPACIRLLRENQIRIKRFLKDELKYDVNASNNASACVSSATKTTNSTSKSHNNGKKQDGPHECTLCERKFVHASGLLRHMEKHALDLIPTSNNTNSGNKGTSMQDGIQSINSLRVVIKCTLCGRVFFEPNEALKHLYSHFPDSLAEQKELDTCSEIPYESYIDDALDSLKLEAEESLIDPNYQEDKSPFYLKVIILSCILQCEFCDFVFSEVSYLFVHSACHPPTRRFECFACEIHVKTSKEIFTHWQAECVFMRENLKIHNITTQRYFVCNVCENKFQSLELLHEHRYTSYHLFPRLNRALGILQLPCEYCESIFENAEDCLAHYEEKHYRKNKRDKDGSSGSSKARQYLCDVCGKSYTQSSHLWQHLRFHQGVKPFACKEPGCTRKFTIRPDLNDHIRKCHTGERPYHCLVCGKRFLTGSVFYQHRLIHRGERRYECEACGKRFYRADALKNHQRIHTGEKPFGCHFCTKHFRQRGDRDKHIRARHSHLDANARLMMQMQKLQLEAAAAAQGFNNNPNTPENTAIISQDYVPINNENISIISNSNNLNDIFVFGDVEISKDLFESILPDMNN